MSKYIAPPLGLIEHHNLKSNDELLLTIDYEMFPDETTIIFKKEAYLVISTDYYSKMDKKRIFVQEEFPLIALSWIVDSIENGFLKKKEEDGFSNYERSTTAEFNGETIGINAMVHCCDENVPGLNIWNGNRKDYIANMTPQQWYIPLYMLKDGLLKELKLLAKKYENGTL
tara:strand:+ start:281 stop:793 length:513 start_codon:yes stop_codon:yes gene_type:complete